MNITLPQETSLEIVAINKGPLGGLSVDLVMKNKLIDDKGHKFTIETKEYPGCGKGFVFTFQGLKAKLELVGVGE